jgi:hypothetical protein
MLGFRVPRPSRILEIWRDDLRVVRIVERPWEEWLCEAAPFFRHLWWQRAGAEGYYRGRGVEKEHERTTGKIDPPG